jgi:hypothetical protein
MIAGDAGELMTESSRPWTTECLHASFRVASAADARDGALSASS